MDLAIQNRTPDLEYKIKAAIDFFKLSRIEQMFSDLFENLPDKSAVDYVGELNRNDIMH